MRPLRLKIKNIASLKGEHLIDFEEIQRKSPLFAITGETGAGKSTILNAMGLALFGKVYKNVTQVDLVTLGEREAEVQLVFQVAGKNYLAHWIARVRKQGGGELLQKPFLQRQVYPLTGDDFKSERGTPVESIENLLNLDFDQFCKCVILNQGEFARFLTSTFTQRKEILEKLYPGELLDNISRELKGELEGLTREKNEIDIKLGELKGEDQGGEDLEREADLKRRELELAESWLKKVEGIEYHFTALNSAYEGHHEYRKKIEQLRAELNEATTRSNKAMKELQEAQAKFEAGKLKEEQELPLLQELLKKEVDLKNARENLALLQKRSVEIEDRIQSIKRAQEENREKKLQWEQRHHSLISSFHRSPEDLKAQRERAHRLIELHNLLQLKCQERRAQDQRLGELETQGRELAGQNQLLKEKLSQFPEDLPEMLKSAEKARSELNLAQEVRGRNLQRAKELASQLDELKAELNRREERALAIEGVLLNHEKDRAALETNLKLFELSAAVELCLLHSEKDSALACPVCEQTVAPERWRSLINTLKKSDIEETRRRFQEISRLIIQLQEENKLGAEEILRLKEALLKKDQEFSGLGEDLKSPLPSLTEADALVENLKRQSWEQENLKLEVTRKDQELARAREAFLAQRTKSAKLSEEFLQLEELTKKTGEGLLPFPADESSVLALKEDLKKLADLLELTAQGEKLHQEEENLKNLLEEKSTEKLSIDQSLLQHQETVQVLGKLLDEKLGGRGAQELLHALTIELRSLGEKKDKAQKDLKAHEDVIAVHRGKLGGHEELLKNFDLLFQKELFEVREQSRVELPTLREELTALLQRLRTISLDYSSPRELLLPIKELLLSEKELLKARALELREKFAVLGQRLKDREKRQDKIKILELTRGEVHDRLQRFVRLSEVLGQDGLRTFVLSLVEENLIIETNEELQKLCQGRYEIIHQSKGKQDTPEFYVLDKYREGGHRKVSTLSGGETFMVSLAMALALAEMTRGQADIDTLFIDEGFGTLDQDSLEDVLDMLNQIQNRGLMVGIISHIKALTSAIPVNLVLTKRQDGTSSVTVLEN